MNAEQRARLDRQKRRADFGSELLGLGMTIAVTWSIFALILEAIDGLS